MLPRNASGQYDGYGGHYAWWGYCWPENYVVDTPPYFAVHPPVYYSYMVARTYGYSPFAYPPGVLTPGSEPVRAVWCKMRIDRGVGETPDSQQGRQPLRIDNPFVDQPASRGWPRAAGLSVGGPRWSIRWRCARASCPNRSGHGRRKR